MVKINSQRLLDDLYKLRSFGAQDTGVVRPSLSDIDMQARHWLAGLMEQAGLQPTIDGIGNVFGRTKNPGKVLLLGSHSDTQPTGGWLDGALGVVYAIEVARSLAEDPSCRDLPVETVAWVDEESTFLSCMGSRAYCSQLGPDELVNAKNDAGQSLTDALAAAGLSGKPERADPSRYLGYLEAHIEQGPHLESVNKKIGVVSAIVGSRNLTVSFTGQQNHAGTTPMPMRKDAGIAMMSFGHRINQAFSEVASDLSVWTMGRVQLTPGASSIIPGHADMHLQFRDPNDEQLNKMQACAEQLVAQMNAEGPVSVELTEHSPPILPADMNASFREHFAQAADNHAAGAWQHMPSAAVHDAMFLSHIMPAGMMFIPSINGISHDFAENTSDSDISLGCQVMASAVASILQESRAA